MRRRLFVFIALLGLLASMPGGVLANAHATTLPFAGSSAVPRAYASLERVTAPDELGFARPSAVAWSAREGRLLVFDAARPGQGVAISTAGRVARAIAGDAASGTLRGPAATRLRAALGGTLRGLAVHPHTGRQFVYAPGSQTLWELDAAGTPLTRRDLNGFGLDDVRAIAVARSADSTDALGRMSVYLADAGRIEDGTAVGGGIYEVILSAPARAPGILAVDAVTLVNTINTGAGSAGWSPDGPDPSGLAYNSTSDRLVALDGEVEEDTGAGWNNVNGWLATRTGATTGTFDTTNDSPANKEPVGAAYDAARDELYVVKDGGSSNIWVYDAATLTVVRTFAVSGAPYNDRDAEGLGFGNGVLYMVDAIDNDLVKVEPGPNGVVGTGGDDVVTDYDLQQFGQDEPEGLDVDPSTGNIWVVSNKISGGQPQPMLELTPNGALVASVSIAAADPESPAGLAIAPPSDGGAGYNIYISDRGLDNSQDPNENDGRIYEFEPGGEPPPGGEKMTNLGFELDANGDGRPDNWTTNAAFTRTSAVVHGGSFAGRHASTSNAGYNVYQTATGITAGDSYAFTGWLNIPATSDAFTFRTQLKWRGPGGAIRTDTIFTRTTATADWIQMSANATAPAGATSVRVTMKLKSLNATIYVDDFSLAG